MRRGADIAKVRASNVLLMVYISWRVIADRTISSAYKNTPRSRSAEDVLRVCAFNGIFTTPRRDETGVMSHSPEESPRYQYEPRMSPFAAVKLRD